MLSFFLFTDHRSLMTSAQQAAGAAGAGGLVIIIW
jgi:hypothetical protein